MTAFDKAFAEVGKLVDSFKANERHYFSGDYQEAEVRKDYIDKFFKALGWDVDHDEQKNPYEQEVKVERGQRQGAAHKRADYAFSMAPNFRDVRFFVEAKKPHGEIETADNYFQTIRYGWNSQNLVAVLTDFQCFHILDCRYKPSIDTALQRGWKKFHYSEYKNPEKFAEVYWLFSHEAVHAGSFDAEKLVPLLPKARGKAIQRGLFKGGYQSIDEEFLTELDEHRDTLARGFKNKNPELDSETLTEITQRTIDRLVFLRFLEDRLIEDRYHVANYGAKGSAWGDFIADCRRLDKIYNGVVFKYHNILDSPDFKVDDDAFSGICEQLAHINSPYDFNAIPIHILGSIYERFLGKVIVATDKRARVEEKPEVRKAGGVYYTPEYIVRYIVENTVGKLIEGKTPAQVAKMRFADIACGSGSFLLGVYDRLMRWHTSYYNAHPTTAKKGDLVQKEDGLHLSLKKRREILLNNVFGVDIDTQAVEVAQLSLYLKLLQEETAGTRQDYQIEFHETLLPPLNKNIVCGNSLIGTDILDGQLFGATEERKLNPMDFETVFPEVMKHGGFDSIVGNPPYIFTRNEGLTTTEKSYFYSHYQHQSAQLNTFGLFLEQSLAILCQQACLGVITPNNWLTIDSFANMRGFLLNNTGDLKVVNILDRVFEAADVDTAITVFYKIPQTKLTICEMQSQHEVYSKEVACNTIHPPSYIIPINLLKDNDALSIMDRISATSCPLGSCAVVSTGLKVYQTGKGKPPQTDSQKENRVFHSTQPCNKTYGKYLEGVDVARYHLSWSGEYLSYGDWIAEPRRSVPFDGERILVRQIPSKPPYLVHGVITSEPYYNDINSMIIFAPTGKMSLDFLLGVVNSKLLSFWFQKTYDKLQRKIFPQFKVKELAEFPISILNFEKQADRVSHDKMVRLVKQMLEARKTLASAKSDKDITYYQNKCASLDRQIDELVYELYGLTEAEIAIVEAA